MSRTIVDFKPNAWSDFANYFRGSTGILEVGRVTGPLRYIPPFYPLSEMRVWFRDLKTPIEDRIISGINHETVHLTLGKVVSELARETYENIEMKCISSIDPMVL